MNTYTTTEAYNRLDKALVLLTGLSRAAVQKHIKGGVVKVDGEVQQKIAAKVFEGQTIIVGELPVEEKTLPEYYEPTRVEDPVILAETDDYLIVNKPAGMLVHPTMRGEKNTLASWIVSQYPDVASVGEDPVRPGIVHRLDKLASGILVVAKTQEMFLHLKQQFQHREVEKYYMVLVHGNIDTDHDIIDFPIDRGKDGKMVARPRVGELSLKTIRNLQPGKTSLTEFWVEKKYNHATKLRVRIHSGRTHQIRVHMNAYGHSIVGDDLYFHKKKNYLSSLDRLFLHATELAFRDLQGKEVRMTSPLPKRLAHYIDSLT